MNAEISYDLVMETNMSFVEGTFRLFGQAWQVFIFSRRDVTTPTWRSRRWASGVTGLVVDYPLSGVLDEVAVEEVLSTATGAKNWSRVSGPDSMQLR